MIRKFIILAMLFVNLGLALAQTCNIQVQTYPVTCNGGSNGKAEIWKNGQLVVLNSGSGVVCGAYEQTPKPCGTIPQGALNITQSSGNLVFTGGNTYYLTAPSFNGDFTFEGPCTVVVCSSVQVANMNFNGAGASAAIAIYVNGSFIKNSIDLHSGVTMYNHGSVLCQAAGFNGKLYNHGSFTCQGNFNLNSAAGVVLNASSLTVNGDFNISQSAGFTNNATCFVGYNLHNNASGSIVNNCTFAVGNTFTMDGPCTNAGNMTVGATTYLNSSTYQGKSGLLETAHLMMNTVAEGTGNSCSSIKVTGNGNTTLNSSAVFQGNIFLCKGTGSYTNNGTFVSPAAANCSCTPTGNGSNNAGGTTGTITWGSGSPILNGSTVTNLTAGSYSVTVNLDGCAPVTLPFTITQPSAVVASASLSGLLATVSASGGNGAPYTYVWSDGVTSTSTRNFSTAASGTYCVTAKDAQNCSSAPSCVNVQNNSTDTSITVHTTNATCYGGNNGKAEILKNGQVIIINGTGGNGGGNTNGANCGQFLQTPKPCGTVPPGAINLTQTSGNLSLGGNNTYYLTATSFNGDITFNDACTLVICSSVQINNINFNGSGATAPIAIYVNGSLNKTTIDLHAGVTMHNHGSVVCQSAGFNGKLYNHGSFTCQGNFNVNSAAGSVYNAASFTVNGDFNINQSSGYVNDGTSYVGNNLHNNASGSIVNNCTLAVGNTFTMDGPCLNAGNFKVDGTTYFNSSTYKANASLFETGHLMVNTVLEGIGSTCASIKVRTNGNTTINGSGKFQGNLDLCRGTGTFTNNGTFVSPATATCSCSPAGGGSSSGGTTTTNGVNATVVWSSGTPVLNGSTATGLSAGTYTVVITIQGQAPITLTFVITQPTQVVASATLSGKVATVVASGGNGGPFTYLWSDGVTTSSTTRDFTNSPAGTYCVTARDVLGCTSASSCVVIQGTTTQPPCSITVNYLPNQQVQITGPLVITASGVVSGITLAQPCIDSLVQLQDACNGALSTFTIKGRYNGCNSGTCPDPNNPQCPVCPNPNNPACLTGGNGCSPQLVQPCDGGQGSGLTVVSAVTSPGCGKGGTATLTVSGGSGSYSTSNPVNLDHDLVIEDLPVGQTVITVYDNATNKFAYHAVTISAAALPAITLQNQNDPLTAVNGQVTVVINNAGSGPYTLNLNFEPRFINNLTPVNGTLVVGPLSLPTGVATEPYLIRVTDGYCREYFYTTDRQRCVETSYNAYTPAVAEVLPSASGKRDGSLALQNLPVGAEALWYGPGLSGVVHASSITGLQAGTYTLLIRNTSTGCVSASSYSHTLQDGKEIRVTVAPEANGSCTYVMTGQYFSANGALLSGSLSPVLRYAWMNPVNDEVLSVSDRYNPTALPLFGKPTYLKVQIRDGNGLVGTGTFIIPANCYPTGCHVLDQDCCDPSKERCDCEDPNTCSPLTISYTAEPARCGTPSRVVLTVTGGINNTYRTSNLENSQTGLYIEGLSAGTHAVTVFDVTSTKSRVIMVTVPTAPVSTITVQNAQNPALSDNNEFTLLVPQDLAGPYVIQFHGFAPYYKEVSAVNGSLGTYQLPTDKGDGPFYVTVQDAYCHNYPVTVERYRNWCSDQNYTPVIQSTRPTVYGQSSGSLQIVNLPLPSGAVANWTGTGFIGARQGTSLLSVPAGNYELIITKPGSNCSYSRSAVRLEDGPRLNIYTVTVGGPCSTKTASAVLVDEFGHVLPNPASLAYSWINPYTGLQVSASATINISNLTLAGNPKQLKLVVSDAGGNRGATLVDLQDCFGETLCPSTLTYTAVSPTCFDGTNGSIQVVAANGGTVTWITPSIAQNNPYGWSKSGLSAGTYELQVHGSSCSAPVSFVIGLSNPPQLTLTRSDEGVGTVRITPANGTAPYSFQWSDQSNASTTGVRSGLVAGSTYTVVVSDSKGCTRTLSFIYNPCALNRPVPQVLAIEGTNAHRVIANGGAAPYEFFWDALTGPEFSNPYGQEKENIPQGSYLITVTDANGCTGTNEYTKGCFFANDLTVTTTDATSSDVCDGTAVIAISGVSDYSQYLVLWDKVDVVNLLGKTDGLRALQSESQIRILNVCSGTHEVMVMKTGTNGCGVLRNYQLQAPVVTTTPDCNNSNLNANALNGSNKTLTCAQTSTVLQFEVTGGKMPYHYQWEIEQNGQTRTVPSEQPGYSQATPGQYEATITDAVGCTRTLSFVVTGTTSALTTTVTAVQPVCTNGKGSVTVTVSDGAAGYSIAWSDGLSTLFQRQDLVAGNSYRYVVTDAAGCTAGGAVTMNQVIMPNSFLSSSMDLCPDQTLRLAAMYVPGYTTMWSSPGVTIPNPNADMITVTSPGTYVLTHIPSATLSSICPNIEEQVVVVAAVCPVTTPCETYTYEFPEPQDVDVCSDNLRFVAQADALRRFDEYIEQAKKNFTKNFVSSTMGSLSETLTMSYADKEQHYTLYYYDQAGNLVRTVPPAGVRVLDHNQTAELNTYWNNSANSDENELNNTTPPSVVTQHTLASTYRYNSLNQLVAQDIPDHQWQDLWDQAQTLQLPSGQVVSTLDAHGNKVWTFANSADQTYLYTSQNNGLNFTEGLALNIGDIRDVQQVPNNEVYYAVGTQGLIMKAANGPANWTVLNSPTTTDLINVNFTSTTSGFIINTAGAIWKTADGGASWAQMTGSNLSSLLAGKTLNEISIQNGYILVSAKDASKGYLYTTNDLTSFTFVSKTFDVASMDFIWYTGTATEVLSGSLVLRKNADNTFSYNRTISGLSGTINNYKTNGTLHVVYTNTGVFISTNGTSFAPVSPALPLDEGWHKGLQVINGRIIARNIYGGANSVYRFTNTGYTTYTANSLNAFYVDINNSEYALYSGNTIHDITGNFTYAFNVSPYNMWWFTNFITSGNVLIAYHDNALKAFRLNAANNSAVQGNTIPLSNVSALTSVNGVLYAVVNNQYYALTVNNGGATPVLTVSASPAYTAPTLTNAKAQTMVQNPATVDWINYSAQQFRTVFGAAAVEVTLKVPTINSTSVQNNMMVAFSDNGMVFKQPNAITNPNLNLAITTLTADHLLKAGTSAAGSIKVASSGNKMYRLTSTTFANNIAPLTEESSSPALSSPVKSLSGDYLITNSGQLYKAATNAGTTSWLLQAENFTGYDVVNGLNPKILAGGTNAALQYQVGGVWQARNALKVAPIKDVSVSSDGTKLVAVGDAGTILYSGNGGTGFSFVKAPDATSITAVALHGSGFLAGNANGQIYRYTPSGNSFTYTSVLTASGTPVKEVLADGNKAWALRGTQLLYSTSGTSFAVSYNAAQTLNDMHLDADGYGYLVGNDGLAFRIVPNGVTEEAESTALIPVSITDNKQLKQLPTDNNITDQTGTGIPLAHLRTVRFTDRLSGYITASARVLKTVDGGYHWKPEGSFSSADPMLAGGVYSDATSVGTLRDRAMSIGSRFWYDELGRLVLSQNAKQFNIASHLGETQYAGITVPGAGTVRAYSYTLYDDIGRITEVGELLTRQALTTYKHESQVQYSTVQNTFVPSGERVQITRTYYDRVAFENLTTDFAQENLRPRVASVTYQERNTTAYDRATHYSYDIHGNVNTLLQEIHSQGETIFKRLDYDYDLISGNVHYVYFQKDQEDGFTHHYTYDADNRIKEVFTSTDNIIWNKEAKYDYYAHGPLARMTTGRDEIDKCDYAYTIQGWIKGVNAQNFSYGLGYFNNDYVSIGTSNLQATPMATNLYNGNISTMTTHTPAFAQENKPTTFTQQYSYDQLNRITGSTVATQGNVHKTAYSYDANGNIATLKRWNSAGMQFDDMAYKYHKVDEGYLKNTNQLKWVDDAVTNTAAHDDDIEDQDRDNYDYDEIGNLTHDEQEEIERIEWNVYGKVDAVIRKAGSNKVDLYFDYDASGNRVSKTATKNGVSTSTFYVRDATGNTMAVYKKNGIVATKVEEHYIYGSSRLGVYAPGEDVSEELEIGITTNEHNLGRRKYEYSDHLGNVRVVFYDRKQMSMGTIAAAYEYYPFGMTLQAMGAYRFGFNGQEREPENFEGSYDYGARMFDARLARWSKIDPLFRDFDSYSPYSYALNAPILFMDDGCAPIYGSRSGLLGAEAIRLFNNYVYRAIYWANNTSFKELEKFAYKEGGQFGSLIGAVAEGLVASRIFNELFVTAHDVVTKKWSPEMIAEIKYTTRFQVKSAANAKKPFDIEVTFDLTQKHFIDVGFNFLDGSAGKISYQRQKVRLLYEVKAYGFSKAEEGNAKGDPIPGIELSDKILSGIKEFAQKLESENYTNAFFVVDPKAYFAAQQANPKLALQINAVMKSTNYKLLVKFEDDLVSKSINGVYQAASVIKKSTFDTSTDDFQDPSHANGEE